MATRTGPINFSEGTIFVTGLEEVNRAFNRIDSRLARAKNKALKKAGEPVRKDAEHLGPFVIRNLKRGPGPSGADWSAVRLGVTQRTVYIAPVEHGLRRKRKTDAEARRGRKFKELVLERAYGPALDHNRGNVIDAFGGMFDDIRDAWNA